MTGPYNNETRKPTMSSLTDRLIIVIPVEKKTQAEAIANRADKTVSNVFNVGLSPTGQAPATYYWCGWAVTPNQHGILTGLVKAANAQIFILDEIKPDEVLAQLGLKRIEMGEMLQS